MKFDLLALLREECTFHFYRENVLYYRTTSGFVFPIPTNDTGNGTFNTTERGMLLMRWLRPAVEQANAE